MEKLDPKTVSGVWQRVQAAKTAPAAPMPTGSPSPMAVPYDKMAEQAAALSQAYMRLSGAVGGPYKLKLRQMSQQCRRQWEILNGCCRLHTGRKVSPPVGAGKYTPESLCRQCMGWQQALLQSYDRHGNDPRYGTLLRELADQLRSHSGELLAILANLR